MNFEEAASNLGKTATLIRAGQERRCQRLFGMSLAEASAALNEAFPDSRWQRFKRFVATQYS